MEIIEFIEGLSPWYWLTLGLVLALCDVAVGTLYVMLIGLAVSAGALWSWLGLPGELQLALHAVSIIVAAVCARRLIGHSKPGIQDARLNDLERANVTVIWINPDDDRHGRGAVEGHGEWPIICEDGSLQRTSSYTVVELRGQRCVVRAVERRRRGES